MTSVHKINRYTLTTSGILNIILGVAVSFFPHETALVFDIQVVTLDQLMPFKIIGASFLAFGMLNYFKRATPMGGIYGKPMILSNMLFHGIIGAQLFKTISSESSILPVYILFMAILFSLFGIWFAYLNFSKSPNSINKDTSSEKQVSKIP